MDVNKALEIITALADGVDPYTGEVFPSDSPYQNAETVRALYLAIKGLERMEVKIKKTDSLPNKAGNPWSPQEDEELSNSFDAGATIKELALKHGRTNGAISSRLAKLGKM